MGTYNVEVEGRYTAVIEVDASSPTEAEEFALREFEQDYDVVAYQGADSWDYTGIVDVQEAD